MEKTKSPFDPAWLVELAEKQFTHKPFIAEALKECTEGWWDNPSFIYFTEFFYPRNAFLPWFLRKSYYMKHDTKGIVLIDLMRNYRVGGILFLPMKKSIEI